MLYAEEKEYREYLLQSIKKLLKETEDIDLLYLIRSIIINSKKGV